MSKSVMQPSRPHSQNTLIVGSQAGSRANALVSSTIRSFTSRWNLRFRSSTSSAVIFCPSSATRQPLLGNRSSLALEPVRYGRLAKGR
jgi:hypothetical protein